MKYRYQKQLYAVVVIAVASTNAWSTIIVNDGLSHTTKTINFNAHGAATMVSSQEQVDTSNSSKASTREISFDEQDNTTDIYTTEPDGFNLVTGVLNSIIALNFLQTDHDVNLEFRLWDMASTQGNALTTINTTPAEQAIFIGFDGLSDLIDQTTAGAVKMFKSAPKAYDFKFNFLQSTTTTPPNIPNRGTAISAPAALTLVGVGLIVIGLTRKKRNISKARRRNLP
jgi:hypothetical protein